MTRLRLLAGLLGCLAMLTAGLPMVAAASTFTGDGAPAPISDDALPASKVAPQPCGHCADCGTLPCPPAAAGCSMVCTGGPPTLGANGSDLPNVQAGKASWVIQPTALRGLSLPPDPFPPRS